MQIFLFTNKNIEARVFNKLLELDKCDLRRLFETTIFLFTISKVFLKINLAFTFFVIFLNFIVFSF